MSTDQEATIELLHRTLADCRATIEQLEEWKGWVLRHNQDLFLPENYAAPEYIQSLQPPEVEDE